jgi:hypothetical protein
MNESNLLMVIAVLNPTILSFSAGSIAIKLTPHSSMLLIRASIEGLLGSSTLKDFLAGSSVKILKAMYILLSFQVIKMHPKKINLVGIID